MTGAPATRDRDAARVPVLGLTVLYDARCSLCAFLKKWLAGQAQLVPLRFVPAGSEEATRSYPRLDHRATLAEITVVGDAGQVYQGTAAWIVTLWALREYRALAHRLSTPTGARLARGATLAAAKWREAQPFRTSQRRWDGGAYQWGDGWSYDPTAGWTFEPPACDSGACATVAGR
ncbi:DCC1-like thiol-disulfide oxidoreductase family protein [Streptomyces sp. NPDC048404]|uniref:thiol-disulfide oxidoreductase DCC family protein n=1 Tax=unclassified Streptomyces TaxID=2593676 RepID=UPI00341A3ACF